MVPNGWERINIDQILTIGSGKDYKHLSSGDIPVYGSGGHMLNVSEYLYDGESVCIGRKGTIDKPMLLDGKFWTVDTLFFTHSFKNTIPQYVYQYFLTINWRKYSEASGVPSLSKAIIQNIKINLPPLPEQRKIAKILSTWDKAIATTEKLIATSQQQKKALMQQLLTGKKRLCSSPKGSPETGMVFEGDWEEIKLSSIALSGKGNFTDGDWIESPYIADSGCRLIQTGNIGIGSFKDKNKKYISESSFDELKCKEVKINDLLICRLAEPAGRACVVPDIGETKMLTSVDVTIMRVDDKKSFPKYLSYYFSLAHTLYIVSTLCGGSTRSRIARTNLGKMKILLPELLEQQKIASVLTAADKEIELLDAKLTHLKQEKKALMQQLLTGKKRVSLSS